MKNIHLIEVKYIPPTNTKGSRFKLISYRFNCSKTLPYNYSFNSVGDMALDYLKNKGIKVLFKGSFKNDATILGISEFNNFKDLNI